MYWHEKSLVVVFLFSLFLFMPSVHASTPALDVTTTERISQVISYDQTIEDDGKIIEAKGAEGENRTGISRTGVELRNTSITGTLNISNVEEIGNSTLSSLNITINDTENIESWYVISKPEYLIYNSSVDMDDPQSAPRTTFFIPELRADDSLIIGFNVTKGSYIEPLNFTEAYSDWRVMSGRSVDVAVNVSNMFEDDVKIYDLEIYKTPHLYNSSNEDEDFAFFSYDDLRGEDASNANIFVDSYGRTVINWTPSDGVLDSNEVRGIIFNSTAPVNVSVNWSGSDQWANWMNMGNLSASFAANGSLAGFNITNVTARPTDAMVSTTKERINESGFWNTTANISNIAEAPLDYELRQITLWATKQGDYSNPGDQSSWVSDTTFSASAHDQDDNTTANATWRTSLNLSAGTSIGNYSMMFNYSYIPVAWVTTDFFIYDDGDQITLLNQTVSGEDDEYLYIEEIYVLLGGYLMKATKSLIPLETQDESHKYQVNITLENIGDERTPELVTIFDLLPEGFNPLHFVNEEDYTTRELTADRAVLRVSDSTGDITTRLYDPDGSDFVLGAEDSGSIDSGPFEDYWGYHIDLNAFEPNSDDDGFYDVDLSESEVLIRYKMSGNHSLARVENAHIVGVDPIRLQGASPAQSVASRLSVVSTSSERIILLSSIIMSLSMLLVGITIMKRFNEV